MAFVEGIFSPPLTVCCHYSSLLSLSLPSPPLTVTQSHNLVKTEHLFEVEDLNIFRASLRKEFLVKAVIVEAWRWGFKDFKSYMGHRHFDSFLITVIFGTNEVGFSINLSSRLANYHKHQESNKIMTIFDAAPKGPT
ncbi:hypothetical protein VE04_03536 [Pseudogymnoascus sp. 24MN13]|nr:hypothetical protein VE04_03536 [Pseudogymnoascus sp. 24MN13]